jgi:uncharacterized membrane protein YfcA
VLSVPIGELAWLTGAIVVAGVVTGILAGLFGIGGGAVIVPVLYEVFRVLDVPEEVRMQLCVGTSLAIIVPTNIRSYLAHRAQKMVLPEVLRQWAVPSVIGVAIGALAAAVAPAALFRLAFVVIASLIAVKLLLGRESWRVSDQLPSGIAMRAYGFLVGLASSLMGVSGGSVANAILTLHGKSIHNAVATSAGLGVPITIAGTVGYVLAGLPHQALLPPLSLGYVSLVGFAVMAPVASLTASYGARLAHRLPKRTLEIAFGLFLLAAAMRFLLTLVW